jgi:hypothetical protein
MPALAANIPERFRGGKPGKSFRDGGFASGGRRLPHAQELDKLEPRG